MSPARWCPTPEQLMILEEMYRSGLRTPNASQIQRITSQLSRYGKIEGKNVFYWFQNHKARDRQKLRRKLSKQVHQQQQLYEQQQQQIQHDDQLSLNHNHTHLLQYLNYPEIHASSQPFHNNTIGIVHQGEIEDASKQMVNSTWNMDLPDRVEMEYSMPRSYSCDWRTVTTMVGVGSTTHCCSKPHKTLDLFPITATSNLKDHGTVSRENRAYISN